jgi:hypothetical protein
VRVASRKTLREFRRFLIGLLVCVPALHAQTPGGELRVRIESNTGIALSGALVALIDAADNVADEGVTRVDGRRTLIASPGSYRVRIRRIGYRPFVSENLTLPRAGNDELVLRVETQRVVLNTMVVSATYQCGAIDPNAPSLSAVWDEIAKALNGSRLTISDLAGVAFMRTFRRQIDRQGSVIANDTSLRRVVDKRPFGGLDAVTLARDGYVVGDESSGWHFYGPDETVLLSDQFAATHCFRIVRDKKHAGQVGVAFAPAPHRKTADIQGTLWVDEATSELRRMDFRYVNAGVIDRFDASGFTHFRRMPSGAWIVDEWKIRMPQLQQTPLAATSLAETNRRMVVSGYIEEGGGIIEPAGLPLSIR